MEERSKTNDLVRINKDRLLRDCLSAERTADGKILWLSKEYKRVERVGITFFAEQEEKD